MAGNARFHNKYHRRGHHTDPSTGYPDSGTDPIASQAEPFLGDFYLDGSLSANKNLFIGGDATILGNLSVLGDLSYLDTIVSVTSALSVVNVGTGPALTVVQHGAQPIAKFIDKEGTCTLLVDDGGFVGFNTCILEPGIGITINNTISSNQALTANANIGAYHFLIGSVAEGRNTRPTGTMSHAEGDNTIATNDSTHAEGYYTSATGQYGAHAEGALTRASGLASHAEGNGTRATADSSHAEGSLTVAFGGYSHAEGYSTSATGDYSHAQGYYATASGPGSHAEGDGTVAQGGFSHAEGGQTTATGDYSHAEGLQTVATGDGSHAEGNVTRASANFSHAEGQGTRATAESTHTEGFYTSATDVFAHAEGESTIASQQAAHAEGEETIASGEASHAQGSRSVASGFAAHAEGEDTIAANNYAHAEGKTAVASGQASHAGGTGTRASGANSFAHGLNVGASGINSFALGANSVAKNGGDIALGSNANAVHAQSLVYSNYTNYYSSCSFADNTFNVFASGGSFLLDPVTVGDPVSAIKFIVAGNGNVGVNTAYPNEQFTVFGNTSGLGVFTYTSPNYGALLARNSTYNGRLSALAVDPLTHLVQGRLGINTAPVSSYALHVRGGNIRVDGVDYSAAAGTVGFDGTVYDTDGQSLFDLRSGFPDANYSLSIAQSGLGNFMKFFGGRLSDDKAFINVKKNSPLRFGTFNTFYGTNYEEHMRIGRTGNIGIHTNHPWVPGQYDSSANEALTVNGNISANGTLSATGAGANYFENNVGIGTNTPEQKLHVMKASAGTVTADTNSIAVFEGGSNAHISILTPDAQTGGVVFGSPTDNLGSYLSWNHDNNALKLATAKTNGFIQLLTNNEAEAVRITSSGNVGIGTTIPAEKLTVSGNISANGYTVTTGLSVLKPTAGADAAITIVAGNVIGDAASIFFGYGGGNFQNRGQIRYYNGGVEAMAFSTATLEAMRIRAGGQVGIGTTQPAEKLTVSGNISANGTLSASGAGNNYFAGNVGIGTAVPAEKLTVSGNISASGNLFINSISSRNIDILHSPANDGTNPVLRIGEYDVTTGQGFSGVFMSYNESTNVFGISSQFAPSAGLPVLSIDRFSNVGIDTDTPNEALTVNGNISSNATVMTTVLSSRFINLVHTPANDGTNPYLRIGETDNTSGNLGFSGMFISYNENTNVFGISSQFASGPGIPALSIDRFGKVGVGTDAPAEKLTVTGNISALSAVYTMGMQPIGFTPFVAKTEGFNLLGALNTNAVVYTVPGGLRAMVTGLHIVITNAAGTYTAGTMPAITLYAGSVSGPNQMIGLLTLDTTPNYTAGRTSGTNSIGGNRNTSTSTVIVNIDTATAGTSYTTLEATVYVFGYLIG